MAMKFPNSKMVIDALVRDYPEEIKARVAGLIAMEIETTESHMSTLISETRQAGQELDHLIMMYHKAVQTVDMLEKSFYRQQGVLENSIGLVLKLDKACAELPPPEKAQKMEPTPPTEGAFDGDVQDGSGPAAN